MKKLLSLCLVLVLVCTLLPGCHGSRGLDPFEVPETFDESRQYEITFWAKNDTNKTQVDIYKQAIADFEVLYPNITVTLRLYTDYSRIYNDVITNITTGTTPNVCITYPDHIATYLTGANTVVPLDQLFENSQYGLGGSALKYDSPAQAEIIPQFLQECAFDGHHYAIPFMRSTEACYVNKTYVEALGYTLPEVLTWDFIWEVSEAATAKAEDGTYLVNGQNVMIPFIYKSTDNMMIQMLAQKNAGYSTAEGDILIFNDTTEELLYTVAEHTQSKAFSTFKVSSYPANFLNKGQCIFAVDSTAGATWMGWEAPLTDIAEEELANFETAVYPVPQFDTANPKMISQGPSVCVFNKEDPQEVMASWLFAQYLQTNEVQIAYSQTEGYVPVTSKAQQSDVYQDYLSRRGEDNQLYYDVKLDAAQLLLDNVEYTFVTPVFNGSASLRNAAGQLIENVVKSVRRSETVDDSYMTRLYSDVNSLYRLNQIGLSNNAAGGRSDLGSLPPTAWLLLGGLTVAWALIGCYTAVTAIQKKKKNKK